ncbi:hypothetical protein Tco_0900692 [Tanacetum coccineum]
MRVLEVSSIRYLDNDFQQIALKYKFEKSSTQVDSYRIDVFRRQDHDDDALFEGESSAKRQKTCEKGKCAMCASSSKTTEGSSQTKSSTQQSQQEYDPWSGDQETDEASLEFLVEISGKGMKWVPTCADQKRIKAAFDNMMKIQCGLVKILDNPTPIYQGCDRNLNAPTRYLYNKDFFYWKYMNSETRKYVLLLHKIHVISFPESDLEELKSRWVRKVIKKFKLEAQYVVHHRKSLWAKIANIRGQLVERSNPYEVYSHQKIFEVIRILHDQGYGQEFMKEITVKRADGEMCPFSESDYKYLNKNDIEDLYLMCFNVNLTASTLTVPGIEDLSPYSIIVIPFIGLVYENSKKERRVMNIDEIPKFCDATLERVLKNVKKINSDVKHSFKYPLLGEQDVEIMRFFEEYIQDRLKHRIQMGKLHERKTTSNTEGSPRIIDP